MSSIPNLLIISLAVATYGLLALLIMRFALRASRDRETRYVLRHRPRATPGSESRPVYPILPVLDRPAVPEDPVSQFPVLAARPPDVSGARISTRAD
jgi:hypothetical protein